MYKRQQEVAAGTVAAWSLTAQDAASAYQLIDRAFAAFAAGDNRPKHIQIPIEVLQALAPPPPPPARSFHHPSTPDLGEIAAMFAQAQRPLFVFGSGANGAVVEARAVLDRTQAASFLTASGNGVVSPEDPLCCGVTLPQPASLPLIAAADLVVVVGASLSEVYMWRDHLGHAAPLVRVDRDVAVLNLSLIHI